MGKHSDAKDFQHSVIQRLLIENDGGMLRKNLMEKFTLETGIKNRKTLTTRLKELGNLVTSEPRGMNTLILLRNAELVGIEKLFSAQVSENLMRLSFVVNNYEQIQDVAKPNILLALLFMITADRTLMTIHSEHLGTQYRTVIDAAKQAHRHLAAQAYNLLMEQCKDGNFADLVMLRLATISREFLTPIDNAILEIANKEAQKKKKSKKVS